MSELTIEFRQMFLLVNRTNGATVLLPSQQHAAELSGSMFTAPIDLQQASVTVHQDGSELADKPTLRPGARLLPYLDYVFHTAITPLPEAKQADIPSTLNARISLAGGYLEEQLATDRALADVEWTFKRPSGQSTLTQKLTDRVRFTLPMTPGSKYEIVVRMGDDVKAYPVPEDGASLSIINRDTGPKQRQPDDDGALVLREYAILYNLTSASEFVTIYPFPTANVPGIGRFSQGGSGSGADHMCGGGQTDGDEDPPPPPPVTG